MSRSIFLCRRSDMWGDSWTYGSWRQYICKRPNGQTQCARILDRPAIVAFAGATGAICTGLSMALAPHDQINWSGAWTALSVLSIMAIAPCVISLLGFRFMKAVGPYNNGDRRVLDGDKV